MTNEELVVLIQTGERDRIMELWAQVERLVMKKAYQMYRIAQWRGITMDDLMQAGFLAMLSAIQYYDGDCAFSTVLCNRMKTEFANATGYLTKTAREDPFWEATTLDAPVSDEDPEGATLADFITDPESMQALPDSEQGQLRDALEREMAHLTEEQQTVIRMQYWYGFDLKQIADQMGKTLKEVQKIDGLAMRRLRRNYKALKPFFASEGEYRLKKDFEFMRRMEELRQPSRSWEPRICWRSTER